MVYPHNGHPSWTNHRCEKLAQRFYAVVPGRDPNPRPLDRESDALPRRHLTSSLVTYYSYYAATTQQPKLTEVTRHLQITVVVYAGCSSHLVDTI